MNIDWQLVQQTLIDWGNAVKDFFNQPVPIIGCTIGFLLITILSILSKTSWGKKSINKVIGLLDNFKKETTTKISNINQMYQDLEKEYNEKLAIAETHNQELENLLLNIGEQLHNKKIKEYVESYRKTKDETKTQVSNLVEQSSKAIDIKMGEFQEQMNAYKKELEKQYQEMVEKYQKELAELQEKANAKKEQLSDEQQASE